MSFLSASAVPSPSSLLRWVLNRRTTPYCRKAHLFCHSPFNARLSTLTTIQPIVAAYTSLLLRPQSQGGSLSLPMQHQTVLPLQCSVHSVTTRFNFDTYKLVRQLELQGLTRAQAVAIMRTINAYLIDATHSVRATTLSTVELENETYLYKSQLQELRNELQLLRQNDSANLKADTEMVVRELESLHQKFADLLASLKGEVAMDLNNHKADSRELGTDTDLRIQEIHHKLVLRLSDLKTKIETMKVEMTRMIVYWIKPEAPQEDIVPSLLQRPSLLPFLGMMSSQPSHQQRSAPN
ncbi:hypothetical protein BASA61_009232 [Batrachochytrium salamandrivorans]|nr:hypothetical protein BASA61_009232 [Batrachochytrium salamandrivorans]